MFVIPCAFKVPVLLLIVSSAAYAVKLIPGNSPTTITSAITHDNNLLPVFCFMLKFLLEFFV